MEESTNLRFPWHLGVSKRIFIICGNIWYFYIFSRFFINNQLEKHKIVNGEEFLKLTDERLKKMGMQNGFHRKKLINCIEKKQVNCDRI